MGKNETLVQKFFEILKSAKPEDIEESIAEAKRKLAEMSKQNKKEDLSKLFETQMQTLKDRDCPQMILEAFQEQKGGVIAKALEMDIPEGNIAFLPVIPKSYGSSRFQTLMVRNGNQVGYMGYTYLDPNQITDVVQTPNVPYFIFNVEDGGDMRGKAPQDAEKLIEKQNRRGLTDTEVIALGIHTDVLKNHFVDAVGSRYMSVSVPDLVLSGDGPRLDWDGLVSANSGWGTASCGK